MTRANVRSVATVREYREEQRLFIAEMAALLHAAGSEAARLQAGLEDAVEAAYAAVRDAEWEVEEVESRDDGDDDDDDAAASRRALEAAHERLQATMRARDRVGQAAGRYHHRTQLLTRLLAAEMPQAERVLENALAAWGSYAVGTGSIRSGDGDGVGGAKPEGGVPSPGGSVAAPTLAIRSVGDPPLPGGIAAEDAAGGHTGRLHVGKTLAELRARFDDPKHARRGQFSTFIDETEATVAIGAGLSRHRVAIEDIAASGAKGIRRFEIRMHCGAVLVRGASAAVTGSLVTVEVNFDGSGGWFVNTGFISK